MSRIPSEFQGIRTEGALLPPDLLRRVVAGTVAGTKPADYNLPGGEKVSEAISQSWFRLQKYWKDFAKERAALAEGDAATALTNQKWLAPLFQELGFGRLVTVPPSVIDEKTYPITRFWSHVAMHWVGCGLDMDRRTPGAKGAALASPHGILQEFLNRSEPHLWGVVSNGLCLRLLRDSRTLSRQAFLEFDLEAIFAGECFDSFGVLWMVIHPACFDIKAGESPETCRLEAWTKDAQQVGARALDALRSGVEKTVEVLGQGFIAHPKNDALRDALQSGTLSKQEFYRRLLRQVYRLLFLFVAEDRGLLHPEPENPGTAGLQVRLDSAATYDRHYSLRRLRTMADRLRGSRHGDLWHPLSQVFLALSGESAGEATRQALALPALGSFLWSAKASDGLNGPAFGGDGVAHLANEDLLAAIRHLAFTEQGSGRGSVLRAVDYRNMGSEELGSVYEGLLERVPTVDIPAKRFSLVTAGGNERKTTGSYYTPDSLVQCLLDSALEPVVAERIKGKKPQEAEQAILSMAICDPACGSGHFLISASHRLADHLARVRAAAEGEEGAASPARYQHALRDVIRRCIFGVDLNPMAIELCKVALWLESMEPGKPLSFLDAHIQCGNALLGTTPALLKEGIPDEAFAVLEGDEKTMVSELKKRNKAERKAIATGNLYMFDSIINLGNMPEVYAKLELEGDDSLEGVQRKERMYAEAVSGTAYRNAHLLADAWCAAFVWKKDTSDAGRAAITEKVLRDIERNPHSVGTGSLEYKGIRALAEQYKFFHWHLAFPQVFKLPGAGETAGKMGWMGGFDVVLGNPPWEKIEFSEEEFFATRIPEIAKAANAAARKKMIAALEANNPFAFKDCLNSLRTTSGCRNLISGSKRFPLCGLGRINTYSVFAEHMRDSISATGRVGVVVPSGVATDDTTKFFFQELVKTGSLSSLLSFENEEFLFPGVHHAMKFCLLTMNGSAVAAQEAELMFFARQANQAGDEKMKFRLKPIDFALINPNTGTCPAFRSSMDAELTKHIYRRIPVLVKDEVRSEEGHIISQEINSWEIELLQGLFNMATASGLFRTQAQLKEDGWTLKGNCFAHDGQRYLPLYEGKMVHQFDHRFGTYEGQTEAQYNQGKLPELTEDQHANPNQLSMPNYWVPESAVADRLKDRWKGQWLLGWRDITNTTNERTVVASVIPRVGVGDTFLLAMPGIAHPIVGLAGNFGVFSFDYVVRQKISGMHLKFHVFKQLPVLPPSTYTASCPWSPTETLSAWLKPKVLELTYTAHDLKPFAEDLGYTGPPFVWNDERRFQLRCELDAAFFHLYLGTPADWLSTATPALLADLPTPRDAVGYIMDTFPIVKRKDEAAHGGVYRTKVEILKKYDELANAIAIFTTAAPAIEKRTVVAVAPPLYPSNEADKAICSAVLAIADQTDQLPSEAYLDMLLLMGTPAACEPFVGAKGYAAIKAAAKHLPTALPTSRLNWSECRKYLEQRKAIQVNHGSIPAQEIGKGADFATVKGSMLSGYDNLAAKIVEVWRKVAALRNNIASATPKQRKSLETIHHLRSAA